MFQIPTGLPYTIGLLLFCLILSVILIRIIVKKVSKSINAKWGSYIYLLFGGYSVYEISKAIQQALVWYESPFFYYWILFFGFCVISYFMHNSKQSVIEV